MGFKEKLRHGFVAKPRTPQQIDVEYQQHAMQIGHKLEGIRELEEQIDNHRQALPKLKAEMAAANKFAQEQAKKAAPKSQPAAHPLVQQGADALENLNNAVKSVEQQVSP